MEQWDDLTNSQKSRWAKKASHCNDNAKARGSRGTRLNGQQIYEVFWWWEFRCAWCSKELRRMDSTIDHVLALSLGGTHTQDNIVPACDDCNQRRSVAESFQGRAIDLSKLSATPGELALRAA